MISFCLITRNCEDTLPACLASIKSIADEIIVVDTDSTDKTRDIAASFGVRILAITRADHPDKFMDIPDGKGGTEVSLADFAWARNLSFDAAKGELIFWLDSVTGETPILVRKTGESYLDFMEIRDLLPPSLHAKCKNTVWRRSDYETLSQSGWTPIRAIKQHWVKKVAYRIIDDGDVTVTEDHSLMAGGIKVAGKDVVAGTRSHPGTTLDHIHASKVETGNVAGITEDLAEAWGFFAAEGSCSIRDEKKKAGNKNRYTWSVNNANRPLIDRYAKIFSDHHTRRFYIVDDAKVGRKLIYKLCATDPKDLCISYRDRFYSRAGRKKVPKEILNSRTEIIAAFLRGYENGDGHIRRTSRDSRQLQSFSTNSPILAAGLVFLYQRLGRDLYCNPERPDKPHIVSCIERSGAETTPGKGSLKRKIEGVRHVHRKPSYEGYVYDLCTGDGTFVGGVGQFVLHNSDDTLEGLDHSYEMLRRFESEHVDAVLLPYEYARDDRGTVITTLWRERLIKNTPDWRWEGVVHEVLPAEGRPIATYDQVRIVHHKETRKHPILKRRNLEILLAKGDRSLPRTWFYLGVEHTYNGDHKAAAEAFEHYLTISTSEEETYQALFYLGDLHRVNQRWEVALSYYQKAIAVRPMWRDAYFGMAMAFGHAQDWDRCLFYVEQGRQQPPAPNTLLTYNPRHEVLGWVEWAVTAYRNKHDPERALACLQEGLKEDPENVVFQRLYQEVLRERNALLAKRAGENVVEHLLREDRLKDALVVAKALELRDSPLVQLSRHVHTLANGYLLPAREITVQRLADSPILPYVEWVYRMAGKNPSARYVALPGCGDSVLARAFFYQGCLGVIAWDPDPAVVEAVNSVQEFPGLRAEFQIQHWPLLYTPDRLVECVVLCGVLEHTLYPEKVIQECLKWLLPGGRLLIVVPFGPSGHAPSARNLRTQRFTPDRLRQIAGTHESPMLFGDPVVGPAWLCLEVRKPMPALIRPREIAILCADALEEWGPWSLQKGIGGSEESVIQMSRALARRGHKVNVYGPWAGEDSTIDCKVEYHRIGMGEYRRSDICIGWRSPELFTGRRLPEAEYLWLWLHDILEPERVKPAFPIVDTILVGSHFHASLYPDLRPKMAVVRLGLDPQEFLVDKLQRQVHRLVWTSCPTRGLETLLDFWPQIRREVPDAELRVFYDFINLDTMLASSDPAHEPESYKRLRDMRPRILEKAKQDGVKWCGRVGQQQIAKEYLQAGVLAYPTSFPESMMISAAKAQRAGCWPVFYPFAALPETIAWGWPSTPENFVQHCVEACLGEKPESEREAMMVWASKCYSWEKTALQWERIMDGE